MYNFIDVNEVSEAVILPSEALKINGEYIENLIPGYRTLQVTGREALSADLTAYETGSRDGSVLSGKRYPARYITVKYQLLADSPEAFRAAYNQLASILNVEEAELTFSDEPDKFFIGTPEEVGEAPGGTNSVVNEFVLFCADPFKYSVAEYEANPVWSPFVDFKRFVINYNGTHKAYPTLEAKFFNEDESKAKLTGSGDCGYVAFLKEDGKTILLGDAKEPNTTTHPYSQTLVSQSFNKENDWNSIAQTNWAANSGVISSGVQSGEVDIEAASHFYTTAPSTSGSLLQIVSRAQTPYITYKVSAVTSGRTENSVAVTVTITATLVGSGSELGTQRGLKGSIQFGGGDWHSVTIKSTAASWKGNSGHTVSLTATVKNLTADTTKIEDIKFKVERVDDLGKAGTLDETICNDLEISTYTAPVANSWYLKPQSYGTGSGWHGPSITRTIPADAAGAVGAANFRLTYSQKMAIGNTSSAMQEFGVFQALVISDSKILAGASIYKIENSKQAYLRFYVNGKTKETIKIDLSYNNKYFGNNNSKVTAVKNSAIAKNGNKVQFNIGGIVKTYYDDSMKDTKATSVTFYFGQYGSKPVISYNGLYWAKFVKNYCDTWEDVPNKFSTNDVVIADCKSGKVLLNDMESPSLGAVGNDWEGFYLSPGRNQIDFAYSDWVESDYAPNFKIRYREVFI